MSAADLRRLLQRATPRVEDVRCPDRTDFIRREHGHLTLREVVDALDALEFSCSGFLGCMPALAASSETAEKTADETAVHGMHRVLAGLLLLSPPLSTPAPAADATPATAETPAEDWQQVVADAKSQGTESFKKQDFKTAVDHYSRAIAATPTGDADVHTLYSNRSAALLKLGDLQAALADAQQCTRLAPTWPKGHFREGCCHRQMGEYSEASRAFSAGQLLEADNKDWQKELEATERQAFEKPTPTGLLRQLFMRLLPELLAAWIRGGDADGVLQVQVNADLKEIGVAKWRLIREGQSDVKAQLRYAFLGQKDYLSNLAANLQASSAESVGLVDLEGQPLRIADIGAFLRPAEVPAGAQFATIHVDVRDGPEKMAAAICRVPCDDTIQRYVAPLKDPPPPKGAIDGVLQLQRNSGFPKALPKLLGFQSLPGGELNFPVVDLKRDAPDSN